MSRATTTARAHGVEAAAQAAEARQAAARAINDSARAAIHGDRQALRDFLTAIEPIVRRVCRGVMGRDSADLEDAVQDSLIDVARGLPQFRFESSPAHYVTRIALRRAIVCHQRARARWRNVAPLDGATLAVAHDEMRGNDARSALVRQMLDDLNEAQATAILLRLMMGHSIEEISEITGVSVNTVKTRLRLGKNQLRRWLERSGEGRRAG